ncbi:MAG: hypothetical protein Q4C96_00895 [Planctomycetia bacterium]|nr:hypothetical protein [Planctomycetia bacterium]
MKSFFNNPEYEWRETFFIMFNEKKCSRLTSERISGMLKDSPYSSLEVKIFGAAAEGGFRRILFSSPLNKAVVEVYFHQGESVLRQSREFYDGLYAILDMSERLKWQEILNFTACYELVYFEYFVKPLKIAEEFSEDDSNYDPGMLLFLLEKLTHHSHGVALDPQSGMILDVD